VIDKNKIPEHIRKELEELIGEEEALHYLETVQYNFRKVQVKILREKVERRFGKGFWILMMILLAIFFLIHHYWRVI